MLSNAGAQALLCPTEIDNDAHFLRAVTQMADSEEITTAAPIFAANGIKLLEQGVSMSSRLYERLIQHRLAAAIDDQLTAKHPVDIRALEAQVHLLTGSSMLGQLLERAMGGKHYLLLGVLRHMKWPARASFKLTVMRHQMPDLYEHSILMMMCAVYLGVQEKLSLDDCAELAAAALLHDVGMLFMPPHWRNASYILGPEERKQLETHPVIAMLVVRSAQSYSVRAADAVLQHHERSDGSGYPSHATGEDISHWGHILMLAEVASAFFSKYNDMPAQRLSLVLRMNHQRFDKTLTQHLFALLAHDAQQQRVHHLSYTNAQVRQVVATLAAVMQHWTLCKRNLPEQWQTMRHARALKYVEVRMQALEKSLAESGSHPRQQVNWLAMFEEDPSSMAELVLINKEALWQVSSCVHTCLRRWPQVQQPLDAVDEVLHDWLGNCRQVLGHLPAASPAATAGAVH